MSKLDGEQVVSPRAILIIGTSDAITAARDKIIEQLHETLKAQNVKEDEGTIYLKFPAGQEIIIRVEAGGFSISPTIELNSAIEIDGWNEQIERIYRNIVQPVTFTIGKLTTWLCEKSLLDELKK